MHDFVVGKGWVSPRDFWRMAPGEIWWTIRAHMPPEALSKPSQNARLYRMLKEAQAKEAGNG